MARQLSVGWRCANSSRASLVRSGARGPVAWQSRSQRLVGHRLVVVMVVGVLHVALSLQVRGVLVHVVNLGLVVDGVRRVLGNDVPRVNQAGEVAEDAKKNVDERVT